MRSSNEISFDTSGITPEWIPHPFPTMAISAARTQRDRERPELVNWSVATLMSWALCNTGDT